MQWGLPALKAVERDAATRGLPLAAASGGLALARPDAAPDPLGAVMGARIVPDFVELHLFLTHRHCERSEAISRRRRLISSRLLRRRMAPHNDEPFFIPPPPLPGAALSGSCRAPKACLRWCACAGA